MGGGGCVVICLDAKFVSETLHYAHFLLFFILFYFYDKTLVVFRTVSRFG